MSVFTKGRRCGVDNCRTKYFQIIDGRRICRFGHVQDGEVQVGSDDDDFGTQGRRIAIPRDSQSSVIEQGTTFFGNTGNALFMQCLQLLIRKQVEWMMDTHGAPAHLEAVVKELFGFYIDRTAFSDLDFGLVDESEVMERELSVRVENSDDENEVVELELTGDDGVVDSESMEGGGSVVPERCKLIDTILLVYIGCMILKLPIYIYDINRWIYRYEVPYMNAMQFLPKEMRERLAPHYIVYFTPTAPPIQGMLHEQLVVLLRRLKKERKLEIPHPEYKPLLFKCVHDLFLPPEIFTAVELMLETIKVNLSYDLDSIARVMSWHCPEVQLLAAVVVAVKLCFGLDGVTRQVEDDSPAAYQVDWNLWADMLRKVWVEDESLSEQNERDVLFWDAQKTDRYFTWFEDNFLKKGGDDQESVVRRRMLSLFPKGTYDDDGQVRQTQRRGRRDSISATPQPQTINEISRIVHESTQEVLYDQENMAPGEQFKSYRDGSAIHPLLTTLYQAAARLCATRPGSLHNACSSIEQMLAKLDAAGEEIDTDVELTSNPASPRIPPSSSRASSRAGSPSTSSSTLRRVWES